MEVSTPREVFQYGTPVSTEHPDIHFGVRPKKMHMGSSDLRQLLVVILSVERFTGGRKDCNVRILRKQKVLEVFQCFLTNNGLNIETIQVYV